MRTPGQKTKAKADKDAKQALRKLSRPGLQYAALPYSADDDLRILLLTSRNTRRWVIPKGWPMKGRKPHVAAAREARQEGGVIGLVGKHPIGAYTYYKRLSNGADLHCTVDVYALKVETQRKRWPEQHERTAHWFTPEEAAEAVQEPELKALITTFSEAFRQSEPVDTVEVGGSEHDGSEDAS
jgi:8-oxo-dGTP pyrophosphatase MutT (NUDIX family)